MYVLTGKHDLQVDMLRRVQERTTIDCPTSGLKPHRQITRELCMQRIKIHDQPMRSLSELIGGLGNIHHVVCRH